MTEITSEKKAVSYPPATIFNFIADFNNFQSLLPAEKVENWQCTEDECSFRIKGMTDLGLKMDEKNEPGKIVMKSHGKNPFDFQMSVNIEEAEGGNSRVNIDFKGDINPFMKMMVEKPLTNFFNMLIDRLTELKLD